MDMYQKRKIRAEKKNNNQEEKLTKVVLNWYPGHMAKTKREIKEKIDLIDIVFEVVDARIPYSSKNKEIEALVERLRTSLTTETDNYELVKIEDRLARLSGGVAVIEVGAPSEIEMQEKKLRIEDALSATKSASKEGIVIGGGSALLCCENSLNDLISTLSGDEKTGAEIVKIALEAPIRQIAKNSGKDDGVVVNKIKSLPKNYGYDALTDEYVNMFKQGIIDPTKVTRCAISNACSVAGTILTTEILVADLPENNTKQNNMN